MNSPQVRVFSGHRGGIYALAFSPDGRKLATGGEDKRIRIWDLASSNVIKELKGHTDIIYSLAWSPDSSLLSSGAIDGTLRLWDINGSTASAASAVPSGISREISVHVLTHMGQNAKLHSNVNILQLIKQKQVI